MLKYLSIVCFFTAAILTGDCSNETNVTCESDGFNYLLGEVLQFPCTTCECTLVGVKCNQTCDQNETVTNCSILNEQLGGVIPLGELLTECECYTNGSFICIYQRGRKCVYENLLLEIGQMFEKDGRQCECQENGNIICYPKLRRCVYKNIVLETGQTFEKDGSQCECQENGNIICNRRKCVYKNLLLETGQTFEKDGYQCECQENGNIICYPKPQKCYYKNDVFAVGELIEFETCSCSCTEFGTLSCQLPPEGCVYDGRSYDVGAMVSDDAVSRCFCAGNQLLKCERNTGKGCVYDGVSYDAGAIVSDDATGICFCAGNQLLKCERNTDFPITVDHSTEGFPKANETRAPPS